MLKVEGESSATPELPDQPQALREKVRKEKGDSCDFLSVRDLSNDVDVEEVNDCEDSYGGHDGDGEDATFDD